MATFSGLVKLVIRSYGKTPEAQARIRAVLAAKEEEENRLAQFGMAQFQRTNRRLDALEIPYVLTLEEFRGVVLPALRHIDGMPADYEGDKIAPLLFLFASDVYRDWAEAKDRLLSCNCNPDLLRVFIHGVCRAYDVIKRAEREGQPVVRALWDDRHCPVCKGKRHPEKSFKESLQRALAGEGANSPNDMDARALLAQFHAGRYELAHELIDDQEGELYYLCPGPFLSNRYRLEFDVPGKADTFPGSG